MGIKYVITVFVSTVFGLGVISGAAAGCRSRGGPDPSPPPSQAGESPASAPSDHQDDHRDVEEATSPGPSHEANGIAFTDLVDATYEDDLSEGIATTRAAYPGGISFSVISSPGVVPGDQALELQTMNARRAAASRGPILEDADAPGRPFAGGELEGRRIVYRTSGGVMHTEVFAFEAAERTVTVFVEVPDPPDIHRDILDTLTASLRVTAP